MTTVDQVMHLQRQHTELAQAFDMLIGCQAYWHASDGDELPDGWAEQVKAMVMSWRAHLDEIESRVLPKALK